MSTFPSYLKLPDDEANSKWRNMVDVQWMAWFPARSPGSHSFLPHHTVGMEYQPFQTNKKQLKMSIPEYPGYFGWSPGYPRVPLLRLPGDPLPSRHRAVPGLDSGAPGQMERIQSAVCGKSPTMAALVVGGPNIGRKTRLFQPCVIVHACFFPKKSVSQPVSFPFQPFSTLSRWLSHRKSRLDPQNASEFLLQRTGMCRDSTTLKASWLIARPTKRMMGAMPQGGIKALQAAKRPGFSAGIHLFCVFFLDLSYL